ncbi:MULTISPECIES: hypothetical protein [unclassified Ruegeria]|uniref:hypothetical protein n=1 Tax=unclassified Ruegeria TaxID=2625375 RepID=UPI00148877A1|nr:MULTISPECIES: hypothetical protein [unclassified Ruegeria]NOD36675.1 hypothetical protein [Ruegeria sp. HKCCD7296]NOD46756.1 hypothetical protein [Ruegeria sp. HKCCD5849]NOD51079.1 hypothetical protein [Ruegeria sp. HKCCD5851]NOD67898.1 hypothetical protein [Ruegeria sp. HKCCD7303]NOE36136.1 hypothetical protein [Ruegeria sp. HKCCD7318]
MFRIAIFLIFAAGSLAAQEVAPEASPDGLNAEPPMTYERLGNILFALDPEAQPHGPGFQMTVAGVQVLVITDINADRMRAMVAVGNAADLSEEDLIRVMQANFDSTLDARYAIANGILWAAFIHPLSLLEKDQLISGLAQTVNIAKTYGTLYSGGAAEFGGGDSTDLQRALIEELLKKGEEI